MVNTVVMKVEKDSGTTEPASVNDRRQLEEQLGFGVADYTAGLEFRCAEWSCLGSIVSGRLAREDSSESGVRNCSVRATRVRALLSRPQRSLANAPVPSAVVSKTLVSAAPLRRTHQCEVAVMNTDFMPFTSWSASPINGSATCDV